MRLRDALQPTPRSRPFCVKQVTPGGVVAPASSVVNLFSFVPPFIGRAIRLYALTLRNTSNVNFPFFLTFVGEGFGHIDRLRLPQMSSSHAGVIYPLWGLLRPGTSYRVDLTNEDVTQRIVVAELVGFAIP